MTPLSHFIILDEINTPAVTESGIYLKVRKETSRKLLAGRRQETETMQETSGSVNRKTPPHLLRCTLVPDRHPIPGWFEAVKKPSRASKESLFLFPIRPMDVVAPNSVPVTTPYARDDSQRFQRAKRLASAAVRPISSFDSRSKQIRGAGTAHSYTPEAVWWVLAFGRQECGSAPD